MKIVIAYPVPNETEEAWRAFKPFVERFSKTYRALSGSPSHTLYAVTYGRGASKEINRTLPNGTRVVTCPNTECFDIGAHQYLASQIEADFLICTSTRTYFHRPDALARFVAAREKHGDGLYAAMASYEASSLTPDSWPNPHIRTCFYGLSTENFRDYPYKIDNREKGFLFESGEWQIRKWIQDIGLPVKVVAVDGEYAFADWPKIKNGFRRGDQSNTLVRDKHWDAWMEADAATKALWAQRAWGNL